MRSFDVLAPLAPGASGDVGTALGAREIGARLAALAPGAPSHPYHFHHVREEWVLVLDGAPVLRTRDGERTLAPGQACCFPPGPAAAHELRGPGTVLVLGDLRAPGTAEYPETGLVRLDDGRLLRSASADAAAVAPADAGPGPAEEPGDPDPTAALAQGRPPGEPLDLGALELQPPDDDTPAGFRARAVRLGPLLDATYLGATLYELDPGEAICPYHWEGAEEEWLLVLAGTPTLREPGGEHVLGPGATVCFPRGPEGAHKVTNTVEAGYGETARVLMLATRPVPDVSICVYPDSEKVGIWPPGGIYLLPDAVGYWHGEA